MSVNRCRRKWETYPFQGYTAIFTNRYGKAATDGLTVRLIHGDYLINTWDLPLEVPDKLGVIRFR